VVKTQHIIIRHNHPLISETSTKHRIVENPTGSGNDAFLDAVGPMSRNLLQQGYKYIACQYANRSVQSLVWGLLKFGEEGVDSNLNNDQLLVLI
jgi:hypothetical protein